MSRPRSAATLLALSILLVSSAGSTANHLAPVSSSEDAAGKPQVEVKYEGGKLSLRFTANANSNTPVDLAGRVFCRGSADKLYGAGALGRRSVSTEWRFIATPPKCDKYMATAESHYAGESHTAEWVWDYGGSPLETVRPTDGR